MSHLTTHARRLSVLVASSLFAVSLAACSDGGAPKPVPSTTPQADVTEDSASTGAAMGSETPTDSPTVDATGEAPSVAPSRPASDAAVLDGMVEEDALMYTANGSGSLAGTTFSTKDGTVHCHIVVDQAVCAVPGSHSTWPSSQNADSSPAITGDTADTVGWSPDFGARLGSAPKFWKHRGDFPSIGAGAPLEEGHKLSVVTSWDNDDEATCGVHDQAVTCVYGKHGFTVSAGTYKTW